MSNSISSRDSLVSVITPSYNSSSFISKSIHSVQSQTYESWEMIIVDDCSTDNSCEIIQDLNRSDNRIKLVRLNKNIGPAASRNISIEKSKGKYIAFLDSDDIWLPAKLEKQVQFMQDKNCVFSYTAYRKIDELGNTISDVMDVPEKVDYESLLKSNVIGCLTAMYDAEVLGKQYMPDIPKRHDYGLWLKILKLGYEAYGLNECLASYRIRKGSLSRDKLKAALHQWKIYRRHEKIPVFRSLYYFVNYAINGYKKGKL